MLIVAYIVLAFTILQLLVALMNLLPGAHLPKKTVKHHNLVSVLIPARNEESNIGTILRDLAEQDYSNIEILVFDDQSEDRTAEIVDRMAAADSRIRLVTSESLPEGWLGKNHACHTLSKLAKGDYLLFLDADVRISNNIIGRAVSYSWKHGLTLISIFPKQIISSYGEKFTVPNMNYILLSLLPLPLVRKSGFVSLSAANGQFMFFRASDYRNIEPHSLMRGNKVEDIAISRHLKENKHKIACLAGDAGITCRMYKSYREAVKGFSKNVIAFFGNSFFLAVMFWLVTTFGFIPVFLSLPVSLYFLYVAVYFLARLFISLSSCQNIIENIIFVPLLQFSMGAFIYNAFLNKYFKKYQWKGRSID
ncbi:MAG: glycosyltransferase family 2 protein [Bacteroidales bacterium]|nr:glycosyltransferase family 2 protein [Bacteroidales bacterium]